MGTPSTFLRTPQAEELFALGRRAHAVKSLAVLAKANAALKAARGIAAPSFAGVAPDDLIARAEAVRLLSREMNRRADYLMGVAVNWNRVTTPWNWPQSRLFEQVPGPLHSRAQIELVAAVTWPDPCEVTDRLIAELWARRYGLA